MSNYNNHWSNGNNTKNQINKFDEQQIYKIKDVEKLQTSFGKKYVLIDEEDNKYWTNNKVDEFIKEHKQIKQIELITSEYKTFKNKKCDEIKFLFIYINY